jgi:DNA polymerase-3 subunit chi
MTRVDFYLLGGGVRDRDLYACRLAEKAFRLGHGAYIYTGDPETAQRLDKLLWTFSQGSFVPHGLYEDAAPDAVAPFPVVIGCLEPPIACHDVLISLTAEVPPFFSRFERVAEVVSADEEDKSRARERFRFYRERGYPLQTHDV